MKKFLTSTQFLVNGVLLIGVGLGLVGMALVNKLFTGEQFDLYTGVVAVFICLVFTFASVIIMIRREYPRVGASTIKGTWAVIIGVFCFLGGASGALWGLSIIVNLLR